MEPQPKPSLIRELSSRIAYAFSGAMAGRVASAAAGVIIARALSVATFGTYMALWELALLCASLSETGLSTGIQREGAAERTRLSELTGNALFMRIILGAFALAIAFFVSGKMTSAPGAGIIYLFLAIASAAVFCADPLYGALQLLGRQNIVAAFESLRGMLMLLMSIGFLFFHAEVKTLAALQAIIYMGSFIAFALYSRKLLALRLNPRSMPRTFARSLVFGLSGQLFALYSKMPLLSLAFFAGNAATGLFSAAYRIADLAIVGGASIYLRAFIPSLFEYYHAGTSSFSAACSFLQSFMLLAGVVAATTLFALAEPVITLMMGEQYRDAAHLLRWLSPTVALSFITYVPDAAMTVSNRNPVKVFFQVLTTIIGACAAILLIPRLGAMGAVYTDLIIMGSQVALLVPYALKKGLVRRDDFIKVALPLAGVVLAAAASNYFGKGHPWTAAAWYSVASVAIVGLWALKSGKPMIRSIQSLTGLPSTGKGASE